MMTVNFASNSLVTPLTSGQAASGQASPVLPEVKADAFVRQPASEPHFGGKFTRVVVGGAITVVVAVAGAKAVFGPDEHPQVLENSDWVPSRGAVTVNGKTFSDVSVETGTGKFASGATKTVFIITPSSAGTDLLKVADCGYDDSVYDVKGKVWKDSFNPKTQAVFCTFKDGKPDRVISLPVSSLNKLTVSDALLTRAEWVSLPDYVNIKAKDDAKKAGSTSSKAANQ